MNYKMLEMITRIAHISNMQYQIFTIKDKFFTEHGMQHQQQTRKFSNNQKHVVYLLPYVAIYPYTAKHKILWLIM